MLQRNKFRENGGPSVTASSYMRGREGGRMKREKRRRRRMGRSKQGARRKKRTGITNN